MHRNNVGIEFPAEIDAKIEQLAKEQNDGR